MAFGFFKDKSKGPLEVSCPLCENTQQESPLAISSYCKGCGAYLSFRKGGEVIARPQATPDPFAHRPPQPKVEIEYKPREEKGPKPPEPPAKAPVEEIDPQPRSNKESDDDSGDAQPPPRLDEVKEEVLPPEPAAESTIEPAVEETPDHPNLPSNELEVEESEPEPQPEKAIPEPARFVGTNSEKDQSSGKKKPEQRRAICFECGDSHLANARANSTQCRKCGRLISMEDIHIREPWSSRVQTRGDVYIHKKGIVLGAAIQCHNLLVEGDFTGSAECSGDLTLRRHGKIIGKVVCDRLLVEKRAKVEFLNTVQMNECKIDGLVTGNLCCRGRLALEKKATLHGNIKVGTLTVADGAKHTGQIQMGGF